MKTKLVESSLGVRTTEQMARKIDEVLPTLPAELRTLKVKSAVDGFTEVGDSRTDVSTITTNTPDRDYEIVIPEGIELEEYRANPVVLYGHNQEKICGKCLWIKPSENGLIAKTYYPQRPGEYEGDWLPDYVFNMVAAEVLKGKSIGFLPLEMREPNAEELSRYPTLQSVVSRSLLFEYSCVACPCNPKALVEAITKGLTNLSQLGATVVGRVQKPKKKAAPVKPYTPPVMPHITFDIAKIAEEAQRNILRRWEV